MATSNVLMTELSKAEADRIVRKARTAYSKARIYSLTAELQPGSRAKRYRVVIPINLNLILTDETRSWLSGFVAGALEK